MNTTYYSGPVTCGLTSSCPFPFFFQVAPHFLRNCFSPGPSDNVDKMGTASQPTVTTQHWVHDPGLFTRIFPAARSRWATFFSLMGNLGISAFHPSLLITPFYQPGNWTKGILHSISCSSYLYVTNQPQTWLLKTIISYFMLFCMLTWISWVTLYCVCIAGLRAI